MAKRFEYVYVHFFPLSFHEAQRYEKKRKNERKKPAMSTARLNTTARGPSKPLMICMLFGETIGLFSE